MTAALGQTAYGAVLRVDWSGGGDFEAINDALAVAESGDTVQTARGVYSELIQLKEGISLLGGYESTGWSRDVENYVTVIDASGLGMPVSATDVTDAVLDGFHVVNWTSEAINLAACSVTISNNTINNPASAPYYVNYGIYSRNSDASITNNVISGAQYYDTMYPRTGIMIVTGAGPGREIMQGAPYIAGNTISDVFRGVTVNSTSSQAADVEILMNSISTEDRGIVFYSDADYLTAGISYNEVTSLQTAVDFSIDSGQVNATISNNLLDSALSNGVYMYVYSGYLNGTLTWNTITSGNSGIDVYGYYGYLMPTCSDNDIDASNEGIHLSSSLGTITDPECSRNFITSGYPGITIINGYGVEKNVLAPTITDNYLYSGNYGVTCRAGLMDMSGNISHNEIFAIDELYCGIITRAFSGDTSTTFDQNTIFGNQDSAGNGITVFTYGELTSSFSHNVILNSNNGLVLKTDYGDATPLISQNTLAVKFTGVDIETEGSCYPDISQNLINAEKSDGIRCRSYGGSMGGTVVSNEINSFLTGVCLNSYSGALTSSITDNTVSSQYIGVEVQSSPLDLMPSIIDNSLINSSSGIIGTSADGADNVMNISRNMISSRETAISGFSYDGDMTPILADNTILETSNGMFLYTEYGDNDPMVVRNSITARETGVRVAVSAGETAPIIVDNVVTGSYTGIAVNEYAAAAYNSGSKQNSMDLTVTHNELDYNSSGIQCSSTSLNMFGSIARNTVKETYNTGITAYAEYGSCSLEITGNTISASSYGAAVTGITGRSFYNVMNSVITSNVVTGSSTGIAFSSYAGNNAAYIADNVIEMTGDTGIETYGREGPVSPTITRNEISLYEPRNGSKAEGYGIICSGMNHYDIAAPTITENVITGGNYGIGVSTSEELTPTISRNVMDSGIMLEFIEPVKKRAGSK